MQRAVGGGGSTFTANFIQSVNDVISDMMTSTGTTITAVESLSDQVDLDNQKYYGIFRDGVLYYLQSSGEWAKEVDIPKAYSRYKIALAHAQFNYINDADVDVGFPAFTDSTTEES